MANLLFLAGSSRKNSLNKKLAKRAAQIAEDGGQTSTYIDLKDFEMPLYDGDLESETGLPENAKKLKTLFAEHDGFFIASPEYNSSMTPLLTNVLDWISRPHEKDEPPLVAFKGKVAALGAVSPGGLGGLRGLVPLRMMLGNIGVFVVPSQIAVGNGYDAFDQNGHLNDERLSKMLQGVLDELEKTASNLEITNI